MCSYCLYQTKSCVIISVIVDGVCAYGCVLETGENCFGVLKTW